MYCVPVTFKLTRLIDTTTKKKKIKTKALAVQGRSVGEMSSNLDTKGPTIGISVTTLDSLTFTFVLWRPVQKAAK